MTADDGARGAGAVRRLLPTLRLLLGGSLGAAVALLLQVPAGGIFGAVAGSALVNIRWSGHRPARWLSRVGLLLLGCVAGARLDGGSLAALANLALPVLIGILVLLAVDVGLALLLSRRFDIDLRTGLLACSPGGFSEMAAVATEVGARAEVVVAVHLARIAAVVLVVMPLLIWFSGPA
ncbi:MULTISPECIES: AbrB family transcriptional regulator [Actinoalloteichus]|uniref:Membrane protein AbrB duplication n=1 Tax=Actinoalloteichus fjordicus TaxID=1612552 RepID=A0AAC9LHF3_9PSEU|nr:MULTISPECIES: AbrB family transcriptional regulator [Actinoalloteichus]APU16405.1 membrane protein AbrB duplication [Actinoalloteichus fjordicus]APU22463.1 membrane protein AbrB duplication [Actinoalloteichus sp. GBA129-24]